MCKVDAESGLLLLGLGPALQRLPTLEGLPLSLVTPPLSLQLLPTFSIHLLSLFSLDNGVLLLLQMVDAGVQHLDSFFVGDGYGSSGFGFGGLFVVEDEAGDVGLDFRAADGAGGVG